MKKGKQFLEDIKNIINSKHDSNSTPKRTSYKKGMYKLIKMNNRC